MVKQQGNHEKIFVKQSNIRRNVVVYQDDSAETIKKYGNTLIWVRIIVALGVLCGLLVLGNRKTADLEITCLDVGQGDCIVLETGEGNDFLIDCGSTSEKSVGQYTLFPFLKHQGISYLEGIFISHTDQDHISGIAELLTTISEKMTAIRVGYVILPDWKEKNEAYLEIETLALEAEAEVLYANQGDCLEIGGLRMEVLYPEKGSLGEDVNEEGMILKVKYKEFCGLFMGDTGSEVEKKLLSVWTDVDFLKVGHHGSRYSSSEFFLQAVTPEIAVISCGEDNSYGHPAEETVERLENAGCQVEYTMKNGAISVYVDGGEWKVERFMAF